MYVVAEDNSTIKIHVKLVWKETLKTEPNFYYPRYPQEGKKPDHCHLLLKISQTVWLVDPMHCTLPHESFTP